jgi:O-antigen/teichoic acid export membrane protein
LLGFNVLTSVGCLFGRAIGKPWMEARYQLLALALHVTLLVWLVPRYDLAGGLVAMLISGVVGTLQYLWVFHRVLARPWREFVARVAGVPLLVSVVGGVAAWAVGGAVLALPGAGRSHALLALGAGGLAGAVLMLAGLTLLKHVTREEWREIAGHLPFRRRPA